MIPSNSLNGKKGRKCIATMKTGWVSGRLKEVAPGNSKQSLV
jgi:hypothetical protein